jgi:uncharacterized protein YabN with tetrapyrrole methylase and pyrophosphatase domain
LNLEYVVDQTTGVAYVRERTVTSLIKVKGYAHVTYRCHTCGELIPKHWEVLFVDPVDGFASPILPAVLSPTMTTHHEWHMAATQED